MSDYHIKYIDGKPIIYDEHQHLISEDAAALLLLDLLQQYSLPCSVYVAYSESTQLCKIGISRNVSRRMSELHTKLLFAIECRSIDVAWQREHSLHKFLTMLGKHIQGEWFSLNGDDLGRIRGIKWSDRSEMDIVSIWAAYLDIITDLIKADGKSTVAEFKQIFTEHLAVIDQWDEEFGGEAQS